MAAVSGAVLLVVLVVVFILLHVGTTPPARSLGAGASKIVPASRAYAKLLKAEGAPIPAFVNVKELVARGLLGQDDLKGFARMEVSVSTSADENSPSEVLIRARQADGTELVLLADGSVQEKR